MSSIIKKDQKFKVERELERDEEFGSILAWIYDASEPQPPGTNPKWLYELLYDVEENSGGLCSELIENYFEVDEVFLEAIKNHPRCAEYTEISNTKYSGVG